MVATGNYIGGCVVLIFTCILCSAGGVGGGGINVPILLLVFGYGFDTAVELSLFIVLGNAFAQTMLNLGKTHPNLTDLPLIYWELVIILLPAQLGGSNIGSILSKILPKSVLYILALLVLSFAAVMSYKKAIHRYHEEKEADRTRDSLAANAPKPVATELDTTENVTLQDEFRSSTHALEEIARATLNLTTETELKVHYPLKVIYVILGVWFVYTMLFIGLGLSNKCSPAYISLVFLLYIPLSLGAFWGIHHSKLLGNIYKGADLEEEHANSMEFGSIDHRPSNFSTASSQNDPKKTSTHQPFPSTDSSMSTTQNPMTSSTSNTSDKNITNNSSVNGPSNDIEGSSANGKQRDTKKTLLTTHKGPPNQGTIVREHSWFMLVSTFCIGVVCSLLGIGGGELLSPLMLTLHILSQVTSATSAFLSFSNTLSLVIRNTSSESCDYGSGLILFFIGLAGGFIGRKIGLIISFEYNRSSFIIFALVVVLILSSLYYVYELSTEEFNSSLSSLC
jgi:uncharacterized membrane protein YfcA